MDKVDSLPYELHCAMSRLPRRLNYSAMSVSAENLPDLIAANTTRMVVSGLYSEKTIFGHRWDNYLQRAWHDSIHIDLLALTDDPGEYRVSWQQSLEMERVAGATLADIIRVDTWGQTLHMAQFNCFPTNQDAFVRHVLRTGQIIQF